MASKRIRGISIEIGGNTTKLQDALRDVDKRSNSLKSELKDVERLLKFDPSNVEALAQRQKILTESVEATTERLDALKKAQSEVQKQFERGDISEKQYRDFRREIEFTEGSLKNLKGELGKLQSEEKQTVTQTNKVRKAFEKAGKAAKEFGEKSKEGMKTAAGATAAGVGGIVTGMQEYNEVLARIKTNTALSGKDFEVVEKGFEKILSVSGDAGAAGETVANLLASGFSDSDLATIIDEVSGAYIKFSDTLTTEGIADGIQETLATGEAIGPFAELLERSGNSVETFNEGLAKAKEKGEGANYVLKTLADQGFGNIYEKYKELNPEVVENAEANADLQKALGELAIVLTPLVVTVTDMLTKIIDWAAANPELVSTVVAITVAVGGFIAILGVLGPIMTAITGLATLLGVSVAAASGIFLAIAAAIAAVIAIGILLYKNWDTVKAKAIELWDKLGPLRGIIVSMFGPFGSLISYGVNLIKNWDKIKEKARELKEKIANLFSGIKWELPKIKLPHFKVSGSLDLNPVGGMSVPRVSVDWYRAGGLFKPNSPQLIGIGDHPTAEEAALPLTDDVFSKIAKGLSGFMGDGGITIQQMVVREEADIQRIARELYKLQKAGARKNGVVG